jgi:formate hydrogenlyase subunit 3/multisubunit Na+/H+ antiporter MnhD subunit
MFGAIVLLLISIAAIFLGYQDIRYKKSFWFAAARNGNKKNEIRKVRVLPLITGISMILLGMFVLLTFVQSLMRYISHN